MWHTTSCYQYRDQENPANAGLKKKLYPNPKLQLQNKMHFTTWT